MQSSSFISNSYRLLWESDLPQVVGDWICTLTYERCTDHPPGHLIWKGNQKSWIINCKKGTKEKKKKKKRWPYCYKSKALINKINLCLKRKKILEFKNTGQKFLKRVIFHWRTPNLHNQNTSWRFAAEPHQGYDGTLNYWLQPHQAASLG